jgi:hypothetical protein
MRHHAGGFIDDDDVIVFVHDREIDGFGFDRERRALVELVTDDVALRDEMAAFNRLTVYSNVAAPYGVGNQRARKSRVMRDENIGALSGFLRRDDELQDLRESTG